MIHDSISRKLCVLFKIFFMVKRICYRFSQSLLHVFHGRCCSAAAPFRFLQAHSSSFFSVPLFKCCSPHLPSHYLLFQFRLPRFNFSVFLLCNSIILLFLILPPSPFKTSFLPFVFNSSSPYFFFLQVLLLPFKFL